MLPKFSLTIASKLLLNIAVITLGMLCLVFLGNHYRKTTNRQHKLLLETISQKSRLTIINLLVENLSVILENQPVYKKIPEDFALTIKKKTKKILQHFDMFRGSTLALKLTLSISFYIKVQKNLKNYCAKINKFIILLNTGAPDSAKLLMTSEIIPLRQELTSEFKKQILLLEKDLSTREVNLGENITRAIHIQYRSSVSILFLALLISSVISFSISSPLGRLATHFEKISREGRLSKSIKIDGGHEIRQLITSFNSMAEKLNHSLVRREELEVALKQAEQANKTTRAFLANMSHEIRTPLHGVLSFCELARKEADNRNPKQLLAHLAIIESKGKHLLTLLTTILDLSIIEAGKTCYTFEEADFSKIALYALLQLQELAEKKKITLNFSEKDLPKTGFFDISKITRVFINIIQNAIRFSPDYGKITIKLSSDDNELRAEISDDGPGIPKDELKLIFERFVMSSRTSDGSGGTGLGLAICHEIIKGHNGQIEAKNRTSGNGSIFCFTIPIYQNQTIDMHPKKNG